MNTTKEIFLNVITLGIRPIFLTSKRMKEERKTLGKSWDEYSFIEQIQMNKMEREFYFSQGY